MLNQVNLIGTVGRDADLRQTSSGESIASLSLATNEKWKDKTGTTQEHTEWHRLTAFGKLAEIVGKYCTKGAMIYVQGRLKTRKYEKDGQERSSTEINVSELKILKYAGDKPAEGKTAKTKPIDDEDIPF